MKFLQVAIELLNRFGDKTNSLKVPTNTGGKKSLTHPSDHSSYNHKIPKPFPAITHQTQSPAPSTINNRNLTQARNRISQSPQPSILDKSIFPTTPLGAPKTPLSSNPNRAYVSPYNTSAPNYQLQYRTQQVKTPFPIINQNEKKMFDKILDFLMGEGQSSQYGMVCKQCYGHNGTLICNYFLFLTNLKSMLPTNILSFPSNSVQSKLVCRNRKLHRNRSELVTGF